MDITRLTVKEAQAFAGTGTYVVHLSDDCDATIIEARDDGTVLAAIQKWVYARRSARTRTTRQWTHVNAFATRSAYEAARETTSPL